MHSLGHLMTSEGEKQFVLIVFLLGQFVIKSLLLNIIEKI